jgi:NDP-sugar pyrophosphorylase family protein
MKAMVLAAGLGTRLRPLTDSRPKALVEVAGKTLLELTLTRLRDVGVREVIINVHHFADMIVDYLQAKSNFDMRIEISREEMLLDTGGGLKKASWFFLEEEDVARDEPFILHNVDVISTVDLRRMLHYHNENHALATLAVQARDSSRLLLFDDQLQLCGRRKAPDHPDEIVCQSSPLQSLAFTGLHIISPRLLPMIREQGVFSIIDSYLTLAAAGQKMIAFRTDQYYWRDLGRLEDLAQATQEQ